MKKLTLLFLFVFLSEIGSEELFLSENYKIDDYSNKYNLISELIPFYVDGKTIKRSDDDSVVLESFGPIIKFDYLGDRIVYTSGYGDVSVPVLFDLRFTENIILHSIIKNGGESSYYEITRDIYFISETEILFSAINPDSGYTDICIYNIDTELVDKLYSEKWLNIHDLYNEYIIISLRDSTNAKEFYRFNIENQELINIKSENAYNMVFKNESEFYINKAVGDHYCLNNYDLNSKKENTLLTNGFKGIVGFVNSYLIILNEKDDQREISVYKVNNSLDMK